MNEPTRIETGEARRGLERDARRELWLIPQAVLALAVVVAIVWVREAFFV